MTEGVVEVFATFVFEDGGALGSLRRSAITKQGNKKRVIRQPYRKYRRERDTLLGIQVLGQMFCNGSITACLLVDTGL